MYSCPVCSTEKECWLWRLTEDVWFAMQGATLSHTAFIFQLRPASWFFFHLVSWRPCRLFNLQVCLNVCVCVCERERESERKRKGETYYCLHTPTYIPYSHSSVFSVGVGSILKDNALDSALRCPKGPNISTHTCSQNARDCKDHRDRHFSLYQSISIQFSLSETKESESEKEDRRKIELATNCLVN